MVRRKSINKCTVVGAEIDVLKSLPFDKVDIKMFLIEMFHFTGEKEKEIRSIFKKAGYLEGPGVNFIIILNLFYLYLNLYNFIKNIHHKIVKERVRSQKCNEGSIKIVLKYFANIYIQDTI